MADSDGFEYEPYVIRRTDLHARTNGNHDQKGKGGGLAAAAATATSPPSSTTATARRRNVQKRHGRAFGGASAGTAAPSQSVTSTSFASASSSAPARSGKTSNVVNGGHRQGANAGGNGNANDGPYEAAGRRSADDSTKDHQHHHQQQQQYRQNRRRNNNNNAKADRRNQNGNATAAATNNNKLTTERLDSAHYVHGTKRYYFDIGQNERGRFCKMSQVKPDGQRDGLFMPMKACDIVLAHLEELQLLHEDSPDRDVKAFGNNGDAPPTTTVDLKELRHIHDDREYTVALKENARGRFVKMTQISFTYPSKSVIFVPIEALAEIVKIMDDLLDKHYVDGKAPPVVSASSASAGSPSSAVGGGAANGAAVQAGEVTSVTSKETLYSHLANVGSKHFFFANRQNENGRYIVVSEVKGRFRNSIVIPENGGAEFVHCLTDCLQRLSA